jgi:hypothetical protein
MECVNLREQFGYQYRITFDPAYDPRHRPKDKLDPWMMRILCERGVILPHGGSLLVVEVERRPVTANRLRRIDCTTTIQDGDGFLATTFDIADIDEVAAIVKPRRRMRAGVVAVVVDAILVRIEPRRPCRTSADLATLSTEIDRNSAMKSPSNGSGGSVRRSI